MKVVATSDLHGELPSVPPCDLLLIAGDICPVDDYSSTRQRLFLNGPFREWLAACPATDIVGVAGNHDLIFQRDPMLVPPDLRWHYLQDQSVDIGGYKIYGTPWQPEFGGWAFNLSEQQLAERWAAIPDDTDILLCHAPPRGYGDRTNSGEETGSPSLVTAICRVDPLLVVYGHIHEGRGGYRLPGRRREFIQLANVSLMDGMYEPRNMPVELDFP